LLAGFAIFGLMMAMFVLSIALWQHHGRPHGATVVTTAPQGAWIPPAMLGTPDEAEVQPYPVKEDLRNSGATAAESELRPEVLDQPSQSSPGASDRLTGRDQPGLHQRGYARRREIRQGPRHAVPVVARHAVRQSGNDDGATRPGAAAAGRGALADAGRRPG